MEFDHLKDKKIMTKVYDILSQRKPLAKDAKERLMQVLPPVNEMSSYVAVKTMKQLRYHFTPGDTDTMFQLLRPFYAKYSYGHPAAQDDLFQALWVMVDLQLDPGNGFAELFCCRPILNRMNLYRIMLLMRAADSFGWEFDKYLLAMLSSPDIYKAAEHDFKDSSTMAKRIVETINYIREQGYKSPKILIYTAIEAIMQVKNVSHWVFTAPYIMRICGERQIKPPGEFVKWLLRTDNLARYKKVQMSQIVRAMVVLDMPIGKRLERKIRQIGGIAESTPSSLERLVTDALDFAKQSLGSDKLSYVKNEIFLHAFELDDRVQYLSKDFVLHVDGEKYHEHENTVVDDMLRRKGMIPVHLPEKEIVAAGGTQSRWKYISKQMKTAKYEHEQKEVKKKKQNAS